MKFSSLMLIFGLATPQVIAATTDCKNIAIQTVAVEGPRDDNHFFQNKLVLVLDKPCAGKTYVHAALTHPAFDGFLTTALTAKTTNTKVTVSVNTSNTTNLSNQIAYIAIK